MNIFQISTHTIYMEKQIEKAEKVTTVKTSIEKKPVTSSKTIKSTKSTNSGISTKKKESGFDQVRTKTMQSIENCTKGKLVKETHAEKNISKNKTKQEKRKKKKGFALSKMMRKRLNIINDDLNETMEDCVVRFKKMNDKK